MANKKSRSESARPRAVEELPSASEAAIGLVGDLAQMQLTKFRFVFGGFFILVGVTLKVLPHLTATAGWFTADFPHEVGWVVMAIGAALAGPEIFKSMKTVFGGT